MVGRNNVLGFHIKNHNDVKESNIRVCKLFSKIAHFTLLFLEYKVYFKKEFLFVVVLQF